MSYRHEVQIYYEDTDLSGAVYHANYLKYFERAREHVIGPAALLELLESGVGWVVYKASLTFKEAARLGDTVEIRSAFEKESEYRVVFRQQAYRGDTLLCDGEIEMCCVNEAQQLVPLPELP